jgi:hypothetical protein
MDDKHGVPVLADLWSSIRGRPLVPGEDFTRHGIFVAAKAMQLNESGHGHATAR